MNNYPAAAPGSARAGVGPEEFSQTLGSAGGVVPKFGCRRLGRSQPALAAALPGSL